MVDGGSSRGNRPQSWASFSFEIVKGVVNLLRNLPDDFDNQVNRDSPTYKSLMDKAQPASNEAVN